MNLNVFWPKEANSLVHRCGQFGIAFIKGLLGQGELSLSSKKDQDVLWEAAVGICSLRSWHRQSGKTRGEKWKLSPGRKC